MWQQGENIFTEDGTATINTRPRQRSDAITQLFDAGHANPQLNYADSQQAFLNGEAAILVNGTWVVDFYDAEAAKEETALTTTTSPTSRRSSPRARHGRTATCGRSRPRSSGTIPETYAAALQVLAFINEHNIDWARTGHMAVRNSVLESEAYAGLPHRDEYTGTAGIARDTPAAENYGAIQDVLNRELQAIWLTGKSIDEPRCRMPSWKCRTCSTADPQGESTGRPRSVGALQDRMQRSGR
jgi:multiple sugar transport system substrate-binding protein